MALFGPQLIYTIIMFVLLAKLGKFYSYGRYLLCHKLFRYLSPNSDELKKAVRNHYKSQTKQNKKLSRLFEIDDDKEEFNIPEGATIELSMSPVLPNDLHYIKYTDDFQSFVDVSSIAILIYISTEIYIAFFRPKDEINLSVVWCSMIIIYGISALASIARNYLRTPEGALLFIFAGVSFILSIIFQIADTRFFDFQLRSAFQNMSSNALSLIQASIDGEQGTTTNVKLPPGASTTQKIYSQLKTYRTNDLLFTCFIGLLSSIIGGLLFFPSFRLARLHFLSLKYAHDSKFKRLVFHISFILPLLVSLCWVRIGQNPHQSLNKTDVKNTSAQQFINLISPKNESLSKNLKETINGFVLNILLANNLKIYLILTVFVLRLVLYRHYAQSYLNLAFEIAASVRKQSTKLTNVKYMSSISSIYQYYGVIASQYVMPLYILLFLVFLLKTLGDYTWCGNSAMCNGFVDSIAEWTSSLKQNATNSPNLMKRFESTHFNVTQSHDVLNKIFTSSVLRSLIGYFTFWTSTVWFTISCFGLLYYHYIDRQYIIE